MSTIELIKSRDKIRDRCLDASEQLDKVLTDFGDLHSEECPAHGHDDFYKTPDCECWQRVVNRVHVTLRGAFEKL